jgi:battenin
MLIPFDRYFASGTGAAGIVGAFMWWELRGLGVSTGVGISAVTI